ncbi:Polyferredoxin NapH (periplasmic nitrate reductase) [hydrothermal vent metagenome]|uniref:Polyferredoxin NapH (Periplasmic nitrate reductase) n=1 Tax=hydrothermal vent metagenome TaxID=652676 RepID=A0A3B0SFD7_9ZZZZ
MKKYPGKQAVMAKGWFKAHMWLILRRLSQVGILGLFLLGPAAGIWIVEGNLNSSMTLGVLPLTDPFISLQSFVAGHIPETTALIGVVIVAGFYAILGGRIYCSWVCPVNLITDAAHYTRTKLNMDKGWQPKRNLRYWVLAMALVVSAVTGTIAWEVINPVSMFHRGIIFTMGLGWLILLAIFLFDVFVSRRGWCGHLCPVGAFYGLLGQKSLLRISARHRKYCDDCMDCFAVCPEPHVITPALDRGGKGASPVISSVDCSNCGRCIDVCRVNVFRFATRRDKAA